MGTLVSHPSRTTLPGIPQHRERRKACRDRTPQPRLHSTDCTSRCSASSGRSMRTAAPKRKYRRRAPVSGGGMPVMVKCEEEEEPVTAPSLRYMAGSECLVNLADLNPYILCSICKGYFVDATTITECLHTFCKSCIVKHFYYSNRCPKCNVVVHQTQPLYNIRLDRQLQDIVYKLVVNLEEREKKQMCEFYKERGLEIPKPTVPQPNITNRGRPRKLLGPVFRIPPELDVSLLLEFIGAQEGTGSYKPLEKKFVRVSGEATIGHVEKFLRRKMELTPMCQVDIICGDHLLEHYQTLREILSAIGKSAVQDGLLVLHFGLVLSPLSFT